MKKSLAQNVIYKAILNVFNLLVPLIVNPYIMRVLDVELYGVYNRVYAEFGVFLTFAAFGIYNYGVREISRIRDDKKRVNQVFTSLFVFGILSNVLVGIFYIFYFFKRASGIDFYVYLVMMIQFVANVFYIEFINEAVENYGFITLKTIIIRIFYFISIFIFVRKPTDIIPYTLVVCLTIFFNNLVSYCYLRKSIQFDFNGLSLKRHAIPLFISFVLTNVEILYTQLDKVMIGNYLGDVQVSFYTIPTTLVGMVCTIPLSLITVLIPRLNSLVGANDKAGYVNLLTKARDIFYSMLTPICFGIIVLAREIMLIYSGTEYEAVYTVLIVAAFVRLFFYGFQSIITNLMMYINGMELTMVILLGIFGIFNLCSNAILIYCNLFTVESALLTTGISVLIFNVVAFWITRKKLTLDIAFVSKKQMQYLFVSLLFIPIALIVKLLPVHFLIHTAIIIVLCVGLYGGFLLYTKDDVLMILFEKFKINKLLNRRK